MNQKSQSPAFVVGQAEENRLKTVTRVGELRPFLVEYVDGRGEKSAQLAFVSPTGNTVFMLAETVNGVAPLAPATKWLVDALKQHMVEKKGVEQV